MEEKKENKILEQALNSTEKLVPQVGENVEGVAIANERNTLYVDIPPYGTGIIFGKEYFIIKDLIKNIQPGSKIVAKVIDTEGENGYIELSLKEAREAQVWQEAQAAMNDKRVLSLQVREANKGGLMITWQGLTGFLPASQLLPEHYPKVAGGDKSRILAELEKFVGKKLDVSIIGVEPKENKLIFSERKVGSEEESSERDPSGKESLKKENTNMMEKYSIGDIVDVEVTGIVDFGIFVKLPSGDEGLLHISELSWSLIGDPRSLYKIGDKITAKVIELNKNKVSLSIKALEENPWKFAKDKYKKGDVVNAVVIKISEHGALVSVEEGVYGLVHISNFKDEAELNEKLKLGQSYKFKINVFDVDSEKMTLTLVEE